VFQSTMFCAKDDSLVKQFEKNLRAPVPGPHDSIHRCSFVRPGAPSCPGSTVVFGPSRRSRLTRATVLRVASRQNTDFDAAAIERTTTDQNHRLGEVGP